MSSWKTRRNSGSSLQSQQQQCVQASASRRNFPAASPKRFNRWLKDGIALPQGSHILVALIAYSIRHDGHCPSIVMLVLSCQCCSVFYKHPLRRRKESIAPEEETEEAAADDEEESDEEIIVTAAT